MRHHLRTAASASQTIRQEGAPICGLLQGSFLAGALLAHAQDRDMRHSGALLLAFALVLSVGCDDAESPTEPTETSTSETVFSVLVASELTLGVGDSVQVRAVVTLQNQTVQILTTTASWQSSNAAVAIVDASGIVTGISAGTSDIIVTYDGVQATSSLTVSTGVSSKKPFLGTVAAPENQSGTLQIFLGETSRVNGTVHTAAGVVDLIGRIDAPTSVVNVAGGGLTFVGTLKGTVLSGSYTGPTGVVGGFSAIDATHTATTAYSGTYTSDDLTAVGNQDSGSFVLSISLDGTVAGASVTADGSALPVMFLGRRDGNSLSLTTSFGRPAAGTLQNGAVTGSFQSTNNTPAPFTATPSTCP
jgi:hypothetical protein